MSVPRRAAERAARPGLLLAAMVAVALNLRPLIAAVPPLITRVTRETGVPGAAVGAATTVALVCMGVFAPAAVRLSRRYAAHQVVTVAVVLVLLGCLLRLGSAQLWLLYFSTFIGGIGIAIIGAMLPGFVRRSFADRAGLATGLYTVGLTAGATAASAFSVPLADLLDSWPASLAAWGLLAVVALLLWVPVTRGGTGPSETLPPPPLPWRSATAWTLTAWLTGSSIVFYVLLTWLPAYYEDLGWTERAAGYLLGSFSLWQILASLLLPSLADRRPDRRPWLVLAVALLLLGLVTTTWAPLAAPWVGVFFLAVGSGGIFSLGLTMIVDLSPTAAASASLSAMGFLVCYAVAALTPPLAGLVRDASGSLRPVLIALVVVTALMVPVGLRLRPGAKLDAGAASRPDPDRTSRSRPRG